VARRGRQLLLAAAGLLVLLTSSADFTVRATSPERAGDSTSQARALAVERDEAQALLEGLRQLGAPNYRGYYEHEIELAQAGRTDEVEDLISRWRSEAIALRATRDQLTSVSGGLADGLPKDVVDGASHLRQLREAGGGADLASPAIVDAQLYLALPGAQMLAGHDAVLGELNAATAALEKRLGARQRVGDQLDQASRQLDALRRMGGADDGLGGRLDQARRSLAGAQTDDQLVAVSSVTDRLLKDIQAARTKRQRELAAASAAAPAASCIDGAPAQLIMVHLATQQLVAYDNGCPWLQAPVTTGRAALPTDRGTFHILFKSPKYKMVSMWPKGSKFWYPDTYVYNAMKFVNDGTFIHSANWQPVSSYGPGSQNGPYASHGCVHVQDAPLQRLYTWAAIGTTVVVGD
jgi:lipoprotein-anchoring transpeptidase ErfK/SrfK